MVEHDIILVCRAIRAVFHELPPKNDAAPLLFWWGGISIFGLPLHPKRGFSSKNPDCFSRNLFFAHFAPEFFILPLGLPFLGRQGYHNTPTGEGCFCVGEYLPEKISQDSKNRDFKSRLGEASKTEIPPPSKGGDQPRGREKAALIALSFP